MKEDLSTMPLSKLVDLLAQETEKFTHLPSYKQYGKEYEESKKKIHQITAVIEDRNKSKDRANRVNDSEPNS